MNNPLQNPLKDVDFSEVVKGLAFRLSDDELEGYMLDEGGETFSVRLGAVSALATIRASTKPLYKIEVMVQSRDGVLCCVHGNPSDGFPTEALRMAGYIVATMGIQALELGRREYARDLNLNAYGNAILNGADSAIPGERAHVLELDG